MKKIICSNSGASAVEFAIIAPLLFVLLFGIIEFSAVLYNQAVITNASREAARYAATFYTNPASATATRPTCEEIQNFVADYVATHILDFTTTTYMINASNVSCPDGTPYRNFANQAGYVDTIRIEYRYGFLVLGNLIQLLARSSDTPWSSILLNAQTAMRDEYQGT